VLRPPPWKSLEVLYQCHKRPTHWASSSTIICAFIPMTITFHCQLKFVHVPHTYPTSCSESANSIACSIVMSKLDYCNSLLYGAPKTTVDNLQRGYECAGQCGNTVWEPLKCQTATPAVTLASCEVLQTDLSL